MFYVLNTTFKKSNPPYQESILFSLVQTFVKKKIKLIINVMYKIHIIVNA